MTIPLSLSATGVGMVTLAVPSTTLVAQAAVMDGEANAAGITFSNLIKIRE